MATTCVICGAPAVRKYRPFCSARCADLDLHRWLRGAYAVPAVEEPDPDAGTVSPDPPAPARSPRSKESR